MLYSSQAAYLRTSLLVLSLALLLPALASAQQISVGSGSGLPGSTVDLTVSFSAGATGVSILQFGLSFPSSLTYVSSASCTSASSKSLDVNPAGTAYMLWGGRTIISSGCVATVRFRVASGAAPGPLAVSIGGIVASDPDGNPVSTSGSNGTVTITAPADVTPPVISGVGTSGISSTGVAISWTTNELSNSQVDYGTSAAYGTSTILNSGMVGSHSQTLSGLAPSTLYHYRVKSRDAANNLATSGDFVFTTLPAPDTTPPAIRNVDASNISSTGANISWSTDEASDTQIDYGPTAAYGSSSTLNPSLVTTHGQMLTGLSAGTTYHYRAKSRDAAGNLALSGDLTFRTYPAPDTTPPVIRDLGVSGVTSTSATISWNTDETSDTQVDYGTTAAYGNSGALNATPVTSHSQTIAGLSAGTTYHYRVKSRDGAGNLSVSADNIFTTAGDADKTPPVIRDLQVSGVTRTSATISWSTDENADAQVDYGTSTAYENSGTLNAFLVTTHRQTLTGLSAGTLYHCRVKSRDAAGNVATSADISFTTSAGSDTTAPVITSLRATAVTATTALITWSTSEESDTQVDYGASAGYGSTSPLNTDPVTSHLVLLSGLKAGTTYHVRARSGDSAGNLALSADLAFTTTSEKDTTPPVISDLSATAGATSAVVRWLTNEPADSQVEYGTEASYGSVSPLDAAVVTTHSQSLTGLARATTYHFRVKSKDAEGNVAVSADVTFKTSDEKPDDTAPKISGVHVSSVTGTGARVEWSLDEPGDAQVEYGLDESYGSQTRLNTEMLTEHSESLSGLRANTKYHFRVISSDAAGNRAVSGDYSFTTTLEKEPTKLTLSYPRMKARRAGPVQMGESDYTGIAIANLDTQAATLTFTAYDAAGRQIEGPGIANPVSRVLKPAEQLPVVDDQLFGDAIQTTGGSGWIKIESTSAKVSGFFLMFNSEMTVLDGANISASPLSSFVLPEIDEKGFTRVNIANPNAEPVELKFELVRSDGTTRASSTRIVSPSGALVTDVFGELFAETPVASDYVRVRAAQGVLPFELIGKEGEYVEGLNGQSTVGGSQVLYSPQYAVGGSWRSALSVVNLDTVPGTVTFRFIRDDASQIGVTRVMPIAGRGKIYVDDLAFFQSLFVNPTNVVTEGYIEIVSSGVKLAGSVVFGDPERRRFSSALPLVSQLQTSVTFSQVSSNDFYFTGLAMLNPGTANTFVTIELYDAQGKCEQSAPILLEGRQRKSIVLTELFPALVGQNRTSGYVRVTSDREIAAFAVFGAHDLSVLSAIPPQ